RDVIAGPKEGAGLEEVRRPEALAPQDPVEAESGLTEEAQLRHERVLATRRELEIDPRMVLQVAADLAGLRHRRDPVATELLGVADTGQHQQLWRLRGAGADDDLAIAGDRARAGPLPHLHADRGPILDDDPSDERPGQDLQVVPLERRAEVRPRGAPADAAVDGRLGDVEALLAGAIVVGRDLVAGLLTGAQERVVEAMLRPASADLHRTVAAAPLICSALPRLQLPEVRQAVGVIP